MRKKADFVERSAQKRQFSAKDLGGANEAVVYVLPIPDYASASNLRLPSASNVCLDNPNTYIPLTTIRPRKRELGLGSLLYVRAQRVRATLGLPGKGRWVVGFAATIQIPRHTAQNAPFWRLVSCQS